MNIIKIRKGCNVDSMAIYKLHTYTGQENREASGGSVNKLVFRSLHGCHQIPSEGKPNFVDTIWLRGYILLNKESFIYVSRTCFQNFYIRYFGSIFIE